MFLITLRAQTYAVTLILFVLLEEDERTGVPFSADSAFLSWHGLVSGFGQG